jgi:16S rRNA (adenine1518-N6/adenine1519-N6)-dimethyltransferase
LYDIFDVTSPRVLRELFDLRGLAPHRQWGQNFLIDANIARKIVAALEAETGDAVIEVGPGAGALTALLAHRGVEVVALEIDRGLVALLDDLLEPFQKVKVLNQDALAVCWKAFVADHFRGSRRVRLVSNLPYVISGPFMFSLFKEGFPFASAVLMLQKEVAYRLVARPGENDYGALSVITAYYCHGEVLFNVGENVFWPRPKVGSAVLRLIPRERLLPEKLESHFSIMVQGLFRQRRKTILNNMTVYFGFDRHLASSLLQEAGIKASERPERLSVEQFALLARITYNYSK